MKQTNKRILALLLVVAMMMCLVACGGKKNNVAGTYHLTKMNMEGVNLDIKQLSEQSGVEMKVDLVLEENGNFSLDMSALGTGENLSGTWKADGNKLTMTAEGEDASAVVDGKTITLEADGASMIFEKE